MIVSKLRSERVKILSEKALKSEEEVKPRVKSRECKKKQEKGWNSVSEALQRPDLFEQV